MAITGRLTVDWDESPPIADEELPGLSGHHVYAANGYHTITATDEAGNSGYAEIHVRYRATTASTLPVTLDAEDVGPNIDLVLTGTHYVPGIEFSYDEGATWTDATYTSATSIHFNVAVADLQTPGLTDLDITLRIPGDSLAEEALESLPYNILVVNGVPEA